MNVKTFELLVKEKRELVSRIEEQMQPDIKAKKLSDRALECFSHAKLSLNGAHEKITIDNEQQLSDALHLFWRAAWNLGEFMARKPNKKE